MSHGGGASFATIAGNQWRSSVVEACAQLLGKPLDELRRQYDATYQEAKNAPAFTNQSRRTAPRDFPDFVIMSTLEAKDARNLIERNQAAAWLFNLMDRSGNGYVCREEFERYTPYMSPASDEAVSSDIFASLIAVQREETQDENTIKRPISTAAIDGENRRLSEIASNRHVEGSADDGSAKERVSKILVSPHERAIKMEATDYKNGTSPPTPTTSTTSLYPVSLALRYQTWRLYYEKVLDQYYKGHPDWNKVKCVCGIDAAEVLIYSEQAMVHAEILPKWGTLFLSQRYLIFYESGTRNHYVARLGQIIDVCKGSIPILMRDVVELYLMSDSQAALKGITSVQTRDNHTNNSTNNNSTNNSDNSSNNNSRKHPRSGQDKLVPQHVEKNMQKFTNGDKPLVFSFSEFMDTSKRDKWVAILKEVVAAHKLHCSMRFGEAGRTSPLLRTMTIREDGAGTAAIIAPSSDTLQGDNNGNSKNNNNNSVVTNVTNNTTNNITQNVSCYYSPFKNEPSPPLLVIAAHANVARFFALKHLMPNSSSNSSSSKSSNFGSDGGRNGDDKGNGNGLSHSSSSRMAITLLSAEEICLLFSNADSHAAKIRWYVDSVRKHNRWSDKSFIERLVGSIRSNIEANMRIYSANDDRPFDPAILATGIGRFGELCAPLVRLVQYCNHLFQWENPPASVLAILACLFIAWQDLISYIPAILIMAQLALIVELKMNYLGYYNITLHNRCLGEEEENTMREEQQRNFFDMLGQVHNGLQAVQNVLTRVNVQLGKFQTLFLWRTHEWRSWALCSIMALLMLALFIVPARHLFAALTIFMFTRHILPPQNALQTFWDSIPPHVDLKGD